MVVISSFGRPLRERFLFDKEYIPLNHGSFGTYPSAVRDELLKYQDEEEKNPDQWLRYTFYPLLEKSREAIATLVNTDPSSLVFIPNATTAINVVLRSLKWEEGDVILTYDTSMTIHIVLKGSTLMVAASLLWSRKDRGVHGRVDFSSNGTTGCPLANLG